ncbi:MAG: diguanylate cyclase [Pseudomonadales bacterium]|nr:diguanylate cyclase [Pseudomonadales bacterium]
MLPIAGFSNAYKRAPATPRAGRRVLVNAYIVANSLVMIGVVLAMVPQEDMSRWIAAAVTLAMLTAAILASVNAILDGAVEEGRAANERCDLALARVQRLYRQLRELARTDELSGCGNEQRVLEEAERFVALRKRTGFRFALLLIRLESETGEGRAATEFVRLAGQLLESSIREVDVIGRLGDGSFALLASDATLEDAGSVAHRLMVIAREMNVPGGDKVRLSVGIAASDAHENRATLIEQARRALTIASSRGGDCVVERFDDTTD